MRATWIFVPSLLMLGACGDPLADIERVSDETFPQETVVATALPTDEELQREGTVLSGLLRKRAAPEETPAPPTSTNAAIEAALAALPENSGADGPALPSQEANAPVGALATAPEPEAARKRGLFAGLRRNRAAEDVPASAASSADAIEAALAALPENTDAQALPVPEADASEDGMTTAPAPEPEAERKRGLFAGLLGKRAEPEEGADPTTPSSNAVEATLASLSDESLAGTEPTSPEDSSIAVVASPESAPPIGSDAAVSDAMVQTAEATTAPPPPDKGVFGWLRRAPIEEETPETALAADLGSALGEADGAFAAPIEEEKIAALGGDSVADISVPAAAAPAKRGGLFGRAAIAKTAGMPLPDVGLNADLPFGQVARVCNVAMEDLGTRVEQAEPRETVYTLYDSAPGSSGPRSFYVTGFSDSCARQFTASLAVFGTPATHEQLRYGLPADEYPYSTTDRAYEKVKAKLCDVERNTPCGERISLLEDTTAFVSIYEHFGVNPRWADMLLHNGALLATAVKTP